ncbi:ParA family protein [Flexithrix dorotheae]|uniref:ParA family protein n=1 Tax=Flexithrix dorotheae TaxID=70993 RepID=UPI000377AB9A|nr:AAA family ATPase [Flexithrix dorotheae]
MTRIIAFTNQKGGVGKTTSVLNVGAALAKKGKKVLMIDLDPQGNLTQSLLPEPPKNTIFTLLLEECKFGEAIVNTTENLLLIPCNNKFANFERQFAADADSQYIMVDFIEAIKKNFPNQLDFIIFDTPPALGLITLNALVACQEVYIPMNSQEYSLTGLNAVIEVVERVKKRTNPDLEVKGMFFSRHNSRKYITRNMVEHLNSEFPNKLMNTHIRVNVALEESPSLRQSVFDYDPSSNGAKDYSDLTDEIIKL